MLLTSEKQISEKQTSADSFADELETIIENLKDAPSIVDELLAQGHRASYIDPENPDVITIVYPDGRKEFLPLD